MGPECTGHVKCTKVAYANPLRRPRAARASRRLTSRTSIRFRALLQAPLRNHHRIALDVLAEEVEAPPDGLDAAVDRDRDVALARPVGGVDPPGDLGRDQAALRRTP